MHFDTSLIILLSFKIRTCIMYNIFRLIFFIQFISCDYDEVSFMSLIDYNRGDYSNLILSSPHGGFLGANITMLQKLPNAGCYNNSLQRCVYTERDCLRLDINGSFIFQSDARCVNERTSTSQMFYLTLAIANEYKTLTNHRPYTILNRLTRQYLDPAEDLLMGTFLLENATRLYMDYHRLIAMSKESIKSRYSRGLMIEFIFHKYSQTIHLGYGYSHHEWKTHNYNLSKSTIMELLVRKVDPTSVIVGNHSLSHFLQLVGFQHVIPSLRKQNSDEHIIKYRPSTYSTEIHSCKTLGGRINSILFSYPIERLRSHSLNMEASRIAQAVHNFINANDMKLLSSNAYSIESMQYFLWSFIYLLPYCFLHI
ncbi:unnamed protein product [Didymodactylos carnosus]|uniref:Uncharacterized protein n=1 Tax=Didymodactylos carnosus TaxID=1234261 RepID=A0A813W124_9BILA|nr:unnamed protein product [Didymodactylos carnosus]CAF1445424.1 unnamed protein product [Didymodactylos carnosus]CAF3638539.1 unnamed protein product [Didymodactylos carnosus]CAF4240897.1 unnamed protein product [Didymodactylos carnosus]